MRSKRLFPLALLVAIGCQGSELPNGPITRPEVNVMAQSSAPAAMLVALDSTIGGSPGVMLQGWGFAPGESVDLVLDDGSGVTGAVTASIQADANGMVVDSSPVWAAASAGSAEPVVVVGTGTSSGREAAAVIPDYLLGARLFIRNSSCLSGAPVLIVLGDRVCAAANPTPLVPWPVDPLAFASIAWVNLSLASARVTTFPVTVKFYDPGYYQFDAWAPNKTGWWVVAVIDPVRAISLTSKALYVGLPDLAITKTDAGGFGVGRTGVYQIQVTNVGPVETRGTTVVTDVLPPGLTFSSVYAPGWSCVHKSGTVSCSRKDILAAGKSLSRIDLSVAIGSQAYPGVKNVVDVRTTTQEVSLINNTAVRFTGVVR